MNMNNYQSDSRQIVSMVEDFIDKYDRDRLLPLIYRYVLPREDVEKIDKCDESDRHYILKWMGQGCTYDQSSETLLDWQQELIDDARDTGEENNEEN